VSKPSLLARLFTAPTREFVEGQPRPPGPLPFGGSGVRRHPHLSELDWKVNAPMPEGTQPPKPAARLTEAELALIHKLGDCWDDYLKLPATPHAITAHHDREAALNGIRELQHLVMVRLARRVHTEAFSV